VKLGLGPRRQQRQVLAALVRLKRRAAHVAWSGKKGAARRNEGSKR
jgi:hypothetical protein